MKSNNFIVKKYLINNAQVIDAFNTITKGNPHTDDLFQDVVMYFLEYDNEELNKIISGGESSFRYFFVRIVKTQVTSVRSSYHYDYRKPYLDRQENSNEYIQHLYDEHNDLQTDEHPLTQPTTLAERVSRLYSEVKEEDLSWYQQELFQCWIDCGAEKGSYQKMNELTNIPVSSIGNDMREIKEFLKNKIEFKLKQELNEEYKLEKE